MKGIRNLAALIVAAMSLAISGFLYLNRSGPAGTAEGIPAGAGSLSQPDADELRRTLTSLSEDLGELKMTIGDIEAPGEEAPGEDAPSEFASIDERLQALESNIARLQSAYNGISLEEASAERTALFKSKDGAVKADEYFEAGKFSIAAEGYMAYYNSHPDDPDARNILDRARKAYQKAGYSDLAMWVQEEMISIFPEDNRQDLMRLAAMQKTAGNYEEAIARAAQAADLATNPQERLWDRLYWAWYNELQHGPAGGLNAYLEVQQEIQAAGIGDDHRLNERAQEKIEELRQQLNATNP